VDESHQINPPTCSPRGAEYSTLTEEMSTTPATYAELPLVLDEKAVLAILPISRPTLRKLREDGTIHAVRFGRRVLYPRASILEYLGER